VPASLSPTTSASTVPVGCWSARPGASALRFGRSRTEAPSSSKVSPSQVNQICLDDVQLASLGELALRCEKVYGPRRDIEWAFQQGTLYLLQLPRRHHRQGAPAGYRTPARLVATPSPSLQRVELFAGMDRRQYEQIARLLKERRFAKGETVIMEGSGGAAFFIIALWRGQGFEQRHQPRYPRAGPYFGEVALIDGGPRSATVTAATDLVCYGLTFWEFRPLVERNGTIGWRLLQALAKQFARRCRRGGRKKPLKILLKQNYAPPQKIIIRPPAITIASRIAVCEFAAACARRCLCEERTRQRDGADQDGEGDDLRVEK